MMPTTTLRERTFLTNGGTETYLMFELGFPLRDGCAFEAFEDDATWQRLERTYLFPIAAAASAHGLGLLYDVMVWRASPDWFARLGYAPSDMERFNRLAVERTRASLAAWRRASGDHALPILLSADIGPRGDGYRVDRASATAADGLAYHRAQIGVLARAGVDLVQALTMTHVNEAIGITLAAREHDLPVIVSATVETDGRLPDGTSLDDFVRRRSKIAFIARKHEIRDAPGLFEACRILFGDEAEAKFVEYFDERPSREVIRASVRPASVWEE